MADPRPHLARAAAVGYCPVVPPAVTTLNRDAMLIPSPRLLEALEERIARRRETLAERDRRFGPQRVRVTSYMENIGWPPLFGYDMRRFYAEPELMLELELRQRIFWLDNSLGDEQAGTELVPTTGYYWDTTLLGQRIRTSPEGVPEFLPHPLASSPDLGLLPSWDFRGSGDMPMLLHQHREIARLSRERYAGRVAVGFPHFHRGPLDILVQMRGYERFAFDLRERPQFLREGLARIVAERFRWSRERASYLGLKWRREETFVADDWVNPPFVSPAVFRDFVLPAYRAIQDNEGSVTGFHTCGPLLGLVSELLEAFPGIRALEVSGWNDVEALDRIVDPGIGFACQVRSTVVLYGTEEQHRKLLEAVRRVCARREVSLCAQAIVRMHDTYDEDIERMNRFIGLARNVLAGVEGKEQ